MILKPFLYLISSRHRKQQIGYELHFIYHHLKSKSRERQQHF